MKKSKNISLFKIVFFVLISSIINNNLIYILSFIYLLFDNYKNAILFILLIITALLLEKYFIDFIPIGIIESKTSTYYIVDKVLYKEKLITDKEYLLGDIITTNIGTINTTENELNKNILFISYNSNKILSTYLKEHIYYHINNNYDESIKNALIKFFYNRNTYDDLTYNLGYSFPLYYLSKFIFHKNKYIGFTFIVIYSILFNYQVKFYLLIIDFLLSFTKLKDIEKFSLKVFILYLINKNLFNNYSILLPLLINIHNYIDLNISFRFYFLFIQSLFFGQVNLLFSFFYKYFLILQYAILIILIIILFIPHIQNITLPLLAIYSFINNLDISIRGSITIVGLILYLTIISILKINNNYLKIIAFTLILISPLNNPFGKVSFIDVGQGDATLIKLPLNKGNILIDTGSVYNYYKLKTYLYKNGIYNIDYLIITHNDSDHNGNIDNLKNDFQIAHLIDTGQDIEFNNLSLKYFDLGTHDNDNDNSLVYGTQINGISYLFTGDISYLVEKLFIKEYGPIHFDVLKVSHHGSYTATSSYFISNILPRYASISTSGKYNHPSESTLETLNKYMVEYFITKEVKNIEFYYLWNINLIKYGICKFVIIR